MNDKTFRCHPAGRRMCLDWVSRLLGDAGQRKGHGRSGGGTGTAGTGAGAGGAPLPHLVDDLSGRTRGQARLLFQDLRQALEHLDQEGLSRSWPTLIDRRRELGESGRACLYPLGELLGRYDSQAQIQGISAARRHLEEEREKDAEESRRQGRVCQALGLTGGAFLVILLI